MNSMSGFRGAAGEALRGNSAGRNLSGGEFTGDRIPSNFKSIQMQKFTPDQMKLFQQMFSQVSPDSFLSKLSQGDEDIFNDIEAPAWRDFQQAQGDLASRFSGQGMGARGGSGFQNAINQQSSDFVTNLQSQRRALQRQALNDLMGFSNDLLSQEPYQRQLYEKPKKLSFLQKLIGGGLRAGGTAAGAYFGGPAGGSAGYHGANALSEAFGI